MKLSMTHLLNRLAQSTPDRSGVANDVDHIPEQLTNDLEDAHGFLTDGHTDGHVFPRRPIVGFLSESEHVAPPMKRWTSSGL